MAERVRRDSDNLVASFEVPYRGTMQAGGVHRVPKDAIYDGRNIFVRDGKLRSRVGVTALNSTNFGDPIVGASLSVTPAAPTLLAVSKSGLWELVEASNFWNKTASLSFAANNYITIDIAYMETTGAYVALIASEGLTLKKWDSVSHTTSDITPSSGVVPKAKSVCVVGRRVVTLTAPNTINWSEVFDITNWNALNYNKLASTSDLGICVRPLGNYGLTVYKERSIHLGRVTGQAFGSAFSFSEPILVEGPAGPHAVVATPLGDIYMTKNGRIGLFDGSTSVKWLGDGVWNYLQKDIHPSYSQFTRGVYDYRLHTVNFYYPRYSGLSDNRGMVIINLPYEGMDIEGTLGNRPFCFLGESIYPVTAACESRFLNTVNRSLLFQTVGLNNSSYYQDEDSSIDVDTYFTCTFQTGLNMMPNGKMTSVEFETLLERGIGYGILNVEPVLSNQLEFKDGYIPDLSSQVINLEVAPVNEYLGGTTRTRTRFFGLKYTWSSQSKVRYAGAYCYGTGV